MTDMHPQEFGPDDGPDRREFDALRLLAEMRQGLADLGESAKVEDKSARDDFEEGIKKSIAGLHDLGLTDEEIEERVKAH
jgi:Holliday junction resolvasome RuvABC DNA-binding subunit